MKLGDELRRVSYVAAAGALICGAAALAALAWAMGSLVGGGVSFVALGFALAELGSAAVFGLLWLMLRHLGRTAQSSDVPPTGPSRGGDGSVTRDDDRPPGSPPWPQSAGF